MQYTAKFYKNVSKESNFLPTLVNFEFGANKHLKGLLTTNVPKWRNSYKNAWASLLVSLVERLPESFPSRNSTWRKTFFPFSCCRSKSLFSKFWLGFRSISTGKFDLVCWQADAKNNTENWSKTKSLLKSFCLGIQNV